MILICKHILYETGRPTQQRENSKVDIVKSTLYFLVAKLETLHANIWLKEVECIQLMQCVFFEKLHFGFLDPPDGHVY